ncbi:MAG: JmjC domain-containing protein [Betaproteobacteria bacterium]
MTSTKKVTYRRTKNNVGGLNFGSISVAEFLAQFWQQKPLLLRRFVDPGSVDTGLETLLSFAQQDDISSRLIRVRNQDWSMQEGPFDALPSLRTKQWTILLQGMDRSLDQAYALRLAFGFLPHARIDDVMISVATAGGGVGAHLDEYDVFLVQGHGQRQWRWGYQSDHHFQANKPLKLLEHFEPQFEAVLEPGDCLYLPPRWAHEGVALSPCSTWSVGFRAPSRQEFLQYFLLEAAESVAGANPRYQDMRQAKTKRAGRIPVALAEQLKQWAMSFRSEQQLVEQALGRFLSEPAANAWFDSPAKSLSRLQWLKKALTHGLALHPASRMVYDTKSVWLNGEKLARPCPLLRQLADQRYINANQIKSSVPEGITDTLSNGPTTYKDPVTKRQDARECKKTVEFQPLFDSLFTCYQQGWLGFHDRKLS